MRKSTLRILMIVLAAFTLNACLKDELTEGEIGDGHIAEQIKLSKLKCKRRQVTINIDSIVNYAASPIFSREFCDCDTVDFKMDTVGSNMMLLGMIKNGQPNPIFDDHISGITDKWIGQVLLTDTFLFDFVTITVALDFNECK